MFGLVKKNDLNVAIAALRAELMEDTRQYVGNFVQERDEAMKAAKKARKPRTPKAPEEPSETVEQQVEGDMAEAKLDKAARVQVAQTRAAAGATPEEIAAELKVGVQTVKNYLK